MKKRKSVLVFALVFLLFCSCASGAHYGKKHRHKRKCNCPTFSFFVPSSPNGTIGLPSTDLS